MLIGTNNQKNRPQAGYIMSGNLIGLLGIVVILGIAYLLSSNRKAINLRIVGAAFALQAVIAVFVIYSSAGKVVIEKMSNAVQNVMDYSRAGIDFMFGGIATEPSLWNFAVHVLPMIIFFSALMSVLYHLKIMQIVVKVLGGVLLWIIGTKAV